MASNTSETSSEDEDVMELRLPEAERRRFLREQGEEPFVSRVKISNKFSDMSV
jgi:hypothetical protein